MFYVFAFVISFLVNSVITWGHSTKSTTFLTSTFLPTHPFLSCDSYFLTPSSLGNQSDANYEVPLLSLASQSDESLNSTLERFNDLSKYFMAKDQMGEVDDVESIDVEQVAEMAHLLFGMDILNSENVDMEDLPKYSTAGGTLGGFDESESFDLSQGSEMSTRGMSKKGKFVSWSDIPALFNTFKCFARLYLGNTQQNFGSIICQCLPEMSTQHQCDSLGPVAHVFACLTGPACPIPYAHPYVSPINKERVHLPFFRWTPTPNDISDSVIRSETKTYYLLWQSIAILYYNAEASACEQPSSRRVETLNGWELVYTVNLGAAKHTNQDDVIPFATLSKRVNQNDNCLDDYLVTIRGTQSVAEWGINFSYNQISEGNATVHRGFDTLANSVFAAFDPFLRQSDDENRLGLITVTGHSLGGGVAAVFSYILTRFYPKVLRSGKNRFRTVLFAAPPAGGSTFVTELANNVIFRSLVAQFDVVPHVPCGSTPICPGALMPTGRYLSNVQYSQYPGRIEIPQRNLPSFFQGTFSNWKVIVWHVCAYECWLSQNADPEHIHGCFADANPKHPTGVCRFAHKWIV